MARTMRTWLAACAVLGLASGAALAQDKVKVGVFPVSSSLPFFVAQERGFFKQQGISTLFVEATSAVNDDGTVSGDSTIPASVDHLLFLREKAEGSAEVQLVRSLSARSARHGRQIPVPEETD